MSNSKNRIRTPMQRQRQPRSQSLDGGELEAPVRDAESESSQNLFPEGFYRISKILDERRTRARVAEVLVVWVDNDPATGQPYEPSWVSLFLTIELIFKFSFLHLTK